MAIAPPGLLHLKIYCTSKTFVAPPIVTSSAPTTPPKSPQLHDGALPQLLASPLKSLSVAAILASSALGLAHGAVNIAREGKANDKQEGYDTIVTEATSPAFSSASILSSLEKPSSAQQIIPLLSGRPNLREILAAELEATEYSDSMAVGTCGPSAMTKDLANIVSDAIIVPRVLRGEHRRNIVRFPLHIPRISSD